MPDEAAAGRVDDEGAGAGALGAAASPGAYRSIVAYRLSLTALNFAGYADSGPKSSQPSAGMLRCHNSLRRVVHPDCVLAAIKLLHTAVWTVMAGSSILALPVEAFAGNFRWALLLTAFVVCECAVLAANRGRCLPHELGGSLHWGPGSQLRHLPARVGGSEQQSDIWYPLCGERMIVLWRWLVRP